MLTRILTLNFYHFLLWSKLKFQSSTLTMIARSFIDIIRYNIIFKNKLLEIY